MVRLSWKRNNGEGMYGSVEEAFVGRGGASLKTAAREANSSEEGSSLSAKLQQEMPKDLPPCYNILVIFHALQIHAIF